MAKSTKKTSTNADIVSSGGHEINNIVVISDTHIGCCLALCHPDGCELDDGGRYLPSRMQLKIWDKWERFWSETVPEWTHGEKFCVVHNGDVIDGVHHNSTTQWSHNLDDQIRHAEKILKPVVDLCDGNFFHVRGTEAHVGKSAIEEERLARLICAVPSRQGQYARYELWIRLGQHLCHFLHHVSPGGSAAYESSAVNAELVSMYNDCGRWNREAPKVVVRSHRHRCIEVRLPAENGYGTVFTTAAWQLRTPYAWKIAGARTSTPQLGGSLIRLHEGEIYTRHHIHGIERTEEVVV